MILELILIYSPKEMIHFFDSLKYHWLINLKKIICFLNGKTIKESFDILSCQMYRKSVINRDVINEQ